MEYIQGFVVNIFSALFNNYIVRRPQTCIKSVT